MKETNTQSSAFPRRDKKIFKCYPMGFNEGGKCPIFNIFLEGLKKDSSATLWGLMKETNVQSSFNPMKEELIHEEKAQCQGCEIEKERQTMVIESIEEHTRS